MNPTPFWLWPLVEQVLLRSPDTIHLGVKRITRSPTQITGGFWFVLIVRLVSLFSLGFCLTSPSWGAEVFAGCGRQHHFLVAGIFSAPVPSFHPKGYVLVDGMIISLHKLNCFFVQCFYQINFQFVVSTYTISQEQLAEIIPCTF